jgi:hypothetical protein
MRVVNKLSLFVGLVALASVIFAGGKMRTNFDEWPPKVIFPQTSVLWRLTLGCASIYCIIYSFAKKPR